VASLEQYSRHPLAGAVLRRAEQDKTALAVVSEVSERPGLGLSGLVNGQRVFVTGRRAPIAVTASQDLPPVVPGLEALVFVGDTYAGALRFHDEPRRDSQSFIAHLGPRHAVTRTLLLSGDRDAEVRYLAEHVGIRDVHAGASPEDKVAIVRHETSLARTMFVGDGINDAPAMQAATVGVAFGHQNDITSEAADAVILEPSLVKLDEFLHIASRMRRIALQSAVGGMALSVAGMVAAASGLLPPIWGAIAQEGIDLAAVLNALRVAMLPRQVADVSAGAG
jgi:P-type E1-E2 ATPase